MGFPGGSEVKNPPASVGHARDMCSIPVGKILWRRKWRPTPVFLSGKFHGQRSLVGYSPWGHKESDTTEQTDRQKGAPGLEERRPGDIFSQNPI